MAGPKHATLKLYWGIWGVLLVLTLVMIALDAPMGRAAEASGGVPWLFVSVLVLAMMTKATLIAGYFMHLRFERFALTLAVILGLPILGAFLFFLIAPDALRIFDMLPSL